MTGTRYAAFVPAMLAAAALAFGTPAGARQADERPAAEAGASEAAERAELDRELRVAEDRLEQAARRIAELSARRLPHFGWRRGGYAFDDRPMLGITIDGETADAPVEGVVVRGVSPGGAAAEAGLRAGDIITAINGEALAAPNSAAANDRLLDFMTGVEEGDTLDVEIMRDGDAGMVTVTPQAPGGRFSAGRMPRAPAPPGAPRAAPAPGFANFLFWRGDGGWGDMEMVRLSEDLGRYFGTDRGLLVVRAPADDKLQLRDGDVIHSIDGREPNSVAHAVRILGSYQAGETMQLEIMRDRRQQTIRIEIPDDRQGRAGPAGAPRAAAGDLPERAFGRR